MEQGDDSSMLGRVGLEQALMLNSWLADYGVTIVSSETAGQGLRPQARTHT